MEKVFLFDLEGVLFNTHSCYIKAIVQTIIRIKNTYSVDVAIPTFSEVSLIVRDKPFEESKQSLMAAYPQFHSYADKFLHLFEHNLVEEFKYSATLLIKDNLNVFISLLKKNYKVGVVTNCPRKIALFLFSLLNEKMQVDILSSYPELILATPEMCNGLAKPNPILYLKAARLLNFQPENCIAIEDSFRGIEAAEKAGMRVVVLKNDDINHQVLKNYKNIELVERLTESQLLPKECFDFAEMANVTNFLETIEVLSLPGREKEKLAEETFKVYRTLFSGRDYASWCELFFNEKLEVAIIILVKDANQQIVGFHLVTGYFIDYNNEKRLVIKLFMGALPEFRKNHLIEESYVEITSYINKKYGNYSIDIFENITGPIAYASACIFFGKNLLTHRGYTYSKEELEYIKFLNQYFNYQMVNNKVYVIRSSSTVYISKYELEKIMNSKNENIKYFIEQTKLSPGVGLACLVRANPGILSNNR